jgi:FlaA1/EpsC-like NDP-sugar epimerase
MKDKYVFLKDTDVFSHISTLSYVPRWIILLIDITLCVLAYYISSVIASHFISESVTPPLFQFSTSLLLLIGLQVFFFWLFHTYSGIIRYSGYVDAVKLLFAVSANLLILFIVSFIISVVYNYVLFLYSALLFYAILSFLLLFLFRLAVKIVFDYFLENSASITPVMIYGTKTAAIGIANMLLSTHDDVKYKLVGFIDDDKTATQRFILGVKVYPLDEEMIKKVIRKKTKAVIISPLKMKEIKTEKDLDVFINNNISILTLPAMSIWGNDVPTIKQIKSVQIEDLLERPKISISTDIIEREHNSKVVLITGAAGSIGSEIVNQVLSYKPKLVVLLDQAESPMHNLKLVLEDRFKEENFTVFLGDVRNKVRMDYMMDLFRPDIIYHAAAYKHVPMMEDNPVESIQVNVIGTKIMADLAVKYKVERFVMVSTDKAVNPTNVMGASKRIAEIYVQSLYKMNSTKTTNSTKFITTRFGNVLGSNGSVIPLFKSQIEKGGPVTVTHPENY